MSTPQAIADGVINTITALSIREIILLLRGACPEVALVPRLLKVMHSPHLGIEF